MGTRGGPPGGQAPWWRALGGGRAGGRLEPWYHPLAPLRLYLCKARYAVLLQIRTLPPEPEDEAHIGPTATYDEVIYPGFQHDITALQIQGYNISYNRHTSARIRYNSGSTCLSTDYKQM